MRRHFSRQPRRSRQASRQRSLHAACWSLADAVSPRGRGDLGSALSRPAAKNGGRLGEKRLGFQCLDGPGWWSSNRWKRLLADGVLGNERLDNGDNLFLMMTRKPRDGFKNLLGLAGRTRAALPFGVAAQKLIGGNAQDFR